MFQMVATIRAAHERSGMIGFLIGVTQALIVANHEQHEQMEFERILEGLSAPEIAVARAKRAEYFKELERKREHQELCDAIRDSRPHGIGVFW